MIIFIGKTTLFSKICRWKNILFDFPPKFVLLCGSQRQIAYEDLHNEGVVDRIIYDYPPYDELLEILKPHKKTGSILILDDGLNAVAEDVSKIFFQVIVFFQLFKYFLYKQNNYAFFSCHITLIQLLYLFLKIYFTEQRSTELFH